MKKSKYTEDKIIGTLKQMETGRAVKDLARKLGVSKARIYTWKSQYGGLEVSEARRPRASNRVTLWVSRYTDRWKAGRHAVAICSTCRRSVPQHPPNTWSCPRPPRRRLA